MYGAYIPTDIKLDLFLDGLTEEDESIKEFAIGGICNCICGIVAHRF